MEKKAVSTAKRDQPQSGEFHILSLSGGGYLGLFTAIVLAELERRLERPVARAFDLVAGTSVGGLLALGLALEVPAATLVRTLRDKGTRVFSDRPKPRTTVGKRLDMLRYLASAKYDSDELRRTLDELYSGAPTLGDIPNHRVVIPAVNLTRGVAQVFKTPHHEKYERDWRVPVLDVALATSAAPTLFPMAEIDEELFTDGGLYAQSPDLVAIHEAEHFLGVDPRSIRLLSIGTTTTSFSIPPSEGTDFGLLNWAFNQRLWSAIMSSQQQIVEYMSGYLLKDRYLRIDAQQSEAQKAELALDVATPRAQHTIAELAESAISESAVSLGKFLGHRAAYAPFYFGANAGDREGLH